MTDRYAPCELCGKWHDNRDHATPSPASAEPSTEASRYVLVRDSDGIRRPYLGCTCHPGPHRPEPEPSAEADAAPKDYFEDEQRIWDAGFAAGRDACIEAAAIRSSIDTETLTAALVAVEENHLNPDCLSDTCDHPDGECPEYSIGCGDAAELAAAYLARLATPKPEGWTVAEVRE